MNLFVLPSHALTQTKRDHILSVLWKKMVNIDFKDICLNLLNFQLATAEVALEGRGDRWCWRKLGLKVPMMNENLLLIHTEHVWIISKTKELSLKI